MLLSGRGVELCLGLRALASWPRFGQVLFFVENVGPIELYFNYIFFAMASSEIHINY
jgi:hypothetical protein